jgi:ATP-dependent helicase HrpA
MRDSSSPIASAADARIDLTQVMAADRAALARRVERLGRGRVPANERDRLFASIARSRERVAQRLARRPRLDYPEALPVTQRRDEIVAAIADSRVLIVCGETGSGKTTQLPKMCIEAGCGARGLIGHTQPRRLAARSVAARLAHELGTTLGDAVGYKVRFSERTHPDAYVKVMTDGILLAETLSDRDLAAYDTIIVDEAHERSLNIDFLLGYLRQLLERRDDLRLIITSATLDAARFAAHFGAPGRAAKVIEVSGRMYPVEVRYRPPEPAGGRDGDGNGGGEADDEEPIEQAVVSATETLWREGPGDILVFLPGEREIRETTDLLRRNLARKPYAAAVEILPLYARLSYEQQQRVFTPSAGRRVVLATNVAETSLTVPGIRSVIDTGLARIKRYSLRNKVTLLQIEKIAQASANQRAGRCGRVGPGVCVRLYSEDDFAARPRFAEPEILRSSLAAVILRMAALDLGAPDAFPFVDAPGPRAIADGYQLLQELGAVDAARSLTPLGRELARLPVDPRLGRMLLAARDGDCLAELLVIVSALAVPDPRERPLERQQAADQAHLRFRDERSDFLGLIALWSFFAELSAQKLSHRATVDHCRAQFVSWLRLREWRDLHAQLEEQLGDPHNGLGWRWKKELPERIDEARYAVLHRALLAGLLSNIGTRDESEGNYLGTRGIRFLLHPGSALDKRNAKWVLAAELTETTRLYARCAGRIEALWVEQVAGPLCERSYFDPRWDAERGEVVGAERVSLYGLTLVPRRRVSYGRVDPKAAHDVFLREALANDQLGVAALFLAHNRALIAGIAELEHKARRQDVLVDEQAMVDFYAGRVPASVHSRAGFEHWRATAEAAAPRLLFMSRDDLMRHAAAHVTEALYPDHIDAGNGSPIRLPLAYRFSPGDALDGVTATVPLALLNRLDDAALSWLVPGMVRDKVTWLLRALPKAWRNRLTPVPEVVTAFLVAHDAERNHGIRIEEALARFVSARLGETLPDDAWRAESLPPHLAMNVRIAGDAGRVLAEGRDLAALRARLGDAAQLSFAADATGYERRGIRRWDFGDLPESLPVVRNGQRLEGYPALVDENDSVAIQLLDTREAAKEATHAGVVRLIGIELADALKRWQRDPPGLVAAALQLKSVAPADALLEDVMDAVRARAFVGDDPLPRTQAAYAEQVRRARTRLPAVAEGAFRLLGTIAGAYHDLGVQLAALPPARSRLKADVAAQREALVYRGFFARTPWAQLGHLPRYLQALSRRLAKAATHPQVEARHGPVVAALWDRFRARRDAQAQGRRADPALEDWRWLLEELKVSLFAQELRTAQPVSFKRLEKAWTDLARG